MKGFFQRDLYLMLVNAKFYLICVLIMGVFFTVGKTGMGFLSLYVMLLVASTLLNLFAHDEQNGWGAYAAAVPKGRRAQVDARYLVALVVALTATGLLILADLLGGEEGQWVMTLLCPGLMLIYIALLFPLTYRFGNKSRIIMIVLIAMIGGGVGAGSAIVFARGGPAIHVPSLAAIEAALLAIGVVAMVVSHRVSVAIVKRQEW